MELDLAWSRETDDKVSLSWETPHFHMSHADICRRLLSLREHLRSLGALHLVRAIYREGRRSINALPPFSTLRSVAGHLSLTQLVLDLGPTNPVLSPMVVDASWDMMSEISPKWLFRRVGVGGSLLRWVLI